jgi:phospholipid/cholesterol/gamma-HCH transport system substrate-binding protein
MISSRAVGAGAFVVIGVVLFTAALFLIGERRMLFEQRFPLYTEFSRLGQLAAGATVRVAGMDAGEVTDIQIPASPEGRFRVRMLVREDLRHLIRADSLATTQTEGLVGSLFVNISTGTEAAPAVADEDTIPGRDPFQLADLLEQASGTVTMLNETVTALRDDITMAVAQVAVTVDEAHALIQDVGPDVRAMADNGNRISADARQIIARIERGEGTIGRLITDDTLYTRAREIADEAQVVMQNVREVSTEARRTLADFRAPEGPAMGMMADVRHTLTQAREATARLSDNMEALSRNFFFRGFFNRRGYFDLNAISPADYRSGVLENGRRRAMRIWLDAALVFDEGPDGALMLTEGGMARIDSAMATYLDYVPANPIVVEGYATGGVAAERFRESRARAALVREYLLGKYGLAPQHTGFIGLGSEAQGSPRDERWDGIALTLFLDREELQFVDQPRFAGREAED